MKSFTTVFITDRKCVDCGGAVEVFGVPDKVWDGLGLPLDAWICLECFARRLKPKNPPDTVDKLNAEIIRQRKHFRLGKNNPYNGDEMRFPLELSLRVATYDSENPGDALKEMTAEQCGKCKRSVVIS